MKCLFLASLILLLPALAAGQTYSAAPMLVVNKAAEAAPQAASPEGDIPRAIAPADALMQNFPESAVTTVGPATPTPAAAPAPASTATVTPAAPPSKLWPKDTVSKFMPSCVTYHRQLIRPCRCTIDRLMQEMPHDEFIAKSDAGTINDDERVKRIRLECATAPIRKE